MQILSGFSKLGNTEKAEILKKNIPLSNEDMMLLSSFHESIRDIDGPIMGLSENYISNFVLPFCIAPNFAVNGKTYFVPMVTEESSVVAAASNAAKFWAGNGGFEVSVAGTAKRGQIHFTWKGDISLIKSEFEILKKELTASVKHLMESMEKRGGGITDMVLTQGNADVQHLKTLNVDFETVDSMGANLINSCLETMAGELSGFIRRRFPGAGDDPEIILAILSNYTPGCLTECRVECDVNRLAQVSAALTPEQFAAKFEKAVLIARNDISRAVTHNKGIFNGIDAVLLATGNDFRAVEASGHAWAARDGTYRSLTDIDLTRKRFSYTLRIPLALGTVGGAISVHPLAQLALKILHDPPATELMKIVAAAGLASNFAAVTSLITGGIQAGHMKLHLNNILAHFNASKEEKAMAGKFFRNRHFSFSAVSGYLDTIRKPNEKT